MSKQQRTNYAITASDRELEDRVRAQMVEMEGVEQEAPRLIRSIQRDPSFKPPSLTDEVITGLYETGMRSSRKRQFIRESTKYLFGKSTCTDQEIDTILANIGPRMRLMVNWLVSEWEEHYRPKTWMDMLDSEAQQTWTVAKRAYNREIDSYAQELKKARAAYDKEVNRLMLAQAVSREKLRALLRDFGVDNAPLLGIKDGSEEIEELSAELATAGITFRGPMEPKQL
jgi:hypothetical protein